VIFAVSPFSDPQIGKTANTNFMNLKNSLKKISPTFREGNTAELSIQNKF
jgi:hypothetical protein